MPTHPLATSRCYDQPYCWLSSLLPAVWGICLDLILATLGYCHRQMGLLSCYENYNGISAENMPYIL